MNGDKEWTEAHTKFKTYYDATKDSCNVASRWGKCDQSDLYWQWRCSYLKAVNYVYLLYDELELPWMTTLKTSLPIFKDIEAAWGKATIN